MRFCPTCNAEYSDDQAICPIDASALLERDAKVVREPVDPLINRTIADKYRIERLIGKGGMGAVYEGRHLLLERSVAVKVLHQNMNTDERAAGRFIREAKASAKIEHPNAVTIHDFGVLKDGAAYLVMEFIRGKSLRQILMQKNRLDLNSSIEIIIQVCNVLETAHHQGIIHRDLKPENVMLKESADGSVMVKVVDFGLAKLVSGDGKEGGSNLTQTGEVLGTPHYMAPEYYEGEEVDRRADIYAIGVILYEMLSGDAPFVGTVQSIIGGHLFKDPQPLFKINPSINEQVNDVVLQALKKKRDERIGSASEFARLLKSALLTSDAMATVKGVSPVAATAAGLEAELRQPLSTSAPLPRYQEPTESNEAVKTVKSTDMLPEKQRPSIEIGRETREVSYNTLAMTQDVGAGVQHLQPAVPQPHTPQPTAPVMSASKANYVTQKSLPPPDADPEGEPETFMEMIVAMKWQLMIGSVLVTFLALALVAFLIYRMESSQIKVQPLPAATTQQ